MLVLSVYHGSITSDARDWKNPKPQLLERILPLYTSNLFGSVCRMCKLPSKSDSKKCNRKFYIMKVEILGLKS